MSEKFNEKMKKKVDEAWKEKTKKAKISPEEPLSQAKDEKTIPEVADFSFFVLGLHMQTLVFLGEVPNPVTGKTEKDLRQARYMIDTLNMLKEKTEGNLNENEMKLIDEILYDLRMKYASGANQQEKK